ncbi:MAG: hypothetical protein IPG50_27635 [Myxococcales bacterium]|nr:hypothetical protein [Myxococcales bacterium]
MTRAVVRYEIFVKSADPYVMTPYMMGYSAGANLRRVAMARARKAPQPPSFMCVGGGVFRQPAPFQDAAASRALEEAAACYVVEYEGPRQDSLWYLDAALKLAVDIAKQCKGIVVDRTADAFVSKDVLKTLAKGVAVRDTVSLRETRKGERVTLATEGMSKYGQVDFVLVNVSLDLAEMGRRLLYDNLCAYSMTRAVLAGQTFGSSAVRMIFAADRLGRLEVRDVHPTKKAALKGNDALIEALRSVWAEAQGGSKSPRKKAPVNKAPAKKKKKVAAKRSKTKKSPTS